MCGVRKDGGEVYEETREETTKRSPRQDGDSRPYETPTQESRVKCVRRARGEGRSVHVHDRWTVTVDLRIKGGTRERPRSLRI